MNCGGQKPVLFLGAREKGWWPAKSGSRQRRRSTAVVRRARGQKETWWTRGALEAVR